MICVNLWLSVTCEPTCTSVWPPFAMSVRKFWFCKLALTCVNLRVHLARALVTLASHQKPCNAVLIKRSYSWESDSSPMYQLPVIPNICLGEKAEEPVKSRYLWVLLLVDISS